MKPAHNNATKTSVVTLAAWNFAVWLLILLLPLVLID